MFCRNFVLSILITLPLSFTAYSAAESPFDLIQSLCDACSEGDVKQVNELIDACEAAGISLDIPDNGGVSAIDRAVNAGFVVIFNILINAGATLTDNVLAVALSAREVGQNALFNTLTRKGWLQKQAQQLRPGFPNCRKKR